MTPGDDTDLAPASHETPSGAGKRRADVAPRIVGSNHPVFTPLAGFFTGTILVVLVLGLLGVVLRAVFGYELSAHPAPFFVAIVSLFVLNVVLLVAPRTRHFARYMLFGLLATPVVVGGVGALTLYVLIKNDG